MVSTGHEPISNDCFACHTITKGTPDEKCLSCHKLDDIGLRTTNGVRIDTSEKYSTTFHQYLTDKTCIRCHSDHKGPIGKGQLKSFEHEALKEFGDKECASCHRRPDDLLHKKVSQSCRQCHNTDKWVPATFQHSKLSSPNDCVSCHPNPSDKLHRRVGEKCGKCHQTNKWIPALFEHNLLRAGNDCITCHQNPSDSLHFQILSNCYKCHNTVKWRPALFDHTLASNKENCFGCHKSPSDSLHSRISGDCGICHKTTEWKPARFDHMAVSKNSECAWCHSRPNDMLHGKVTEKCGDCHTTFRWTPASFEHSEYFQLDRDHKTECETCHQGNSYSEYTCYGCHEHSTSKMRKEHEKEGMRDFHNCAECHRNADKHGAERKWKTMRSQTKQDSEYRKKDKRKKHHRRKKDNDDHDDDHDDDD
ncbi:hypothetical protein ACFL5V_13760, partial [Fibrobacterota bacterium]